MVNIIHLNTLLDIMITMLLNHYTYFFHKLLDIFDKNEITMSLMVKD